MTNTNKLPPPKVLCIKCKWHNEKGCWFLSDDPQVASITKPKHGCNQGKLKEYIMEEDGVLK